MGVFNIIVLHILQVIKCMLQKPDSSFEFAFDEDGNWAFVTADGTSTTDAMTQIYNIIFGAKATLSKNKNRKKNHKKDNKYLYLIKLKNKKY